MLYNHQFSLVLIGQRLRSFTSYLSVFTFTQRYWVKWRPVSYILKKPNFFFFDNKLPILKSSNEPWGLEAAWAMSLNWTSNRFLKGLLQISRFECGLNTFWLTQIRLDLFSVVFTLSLKDIFFGMWVSD